MSAHDDGTAAGAAAQHWQRSHGSSRMGIGGKLLLAFGAIAGLTVLATAIAWVLLGNIRDNLQLIAQGSLPEIVLSFRLAESSAQLSASIPLLVASTNEGEMAERLRGIEAQLDAIEEFSAHQVQRSDDQIALRPGLDRLHPGIRFHIEALQAAVRESLAASKEREALVSSLSRDHLAFLEIIDPVIGDARGDMIASTRRSVADGTARISSLIDDSFEGLRGVLELQANINLLMAMSHQVAATNDVFLVYDRRTAAVAPIAEIKNAFSQLPETDLAQRLRDSAQEIIRRVIGADNIFELRKGILGGKVADAGPLRDRLAQEIMVLGQAQASFLTLADAVIESVDGGILEAATGASREGQHIISETQSGIGRFESVLLLQSDTNQLFSVLSEAAATNRVGDIQALERRYDALNRDIERHLIARSTDSEVRASVDRLLAYGRDDRSILSVRLRELAARQEAAALLQETQSLAGRLSESTHGLVEEAEASARNASTEALGSLAQGTLAFVSIAAFSLGVAVLIAWRYVFRRIVRRLIDLSTTMLTLADGKLETAMPSTRGNDEITDMSRALLIFRADAVRRREAERAVRENEQRMRRILASSPIGVADREHRGFAPEVRQRTHGPAVRHGRDRVGRPPRDRLIRGCQ